MLINDLRVIGNRLLKFRKRAGLTQAEVAEAAGFSDRTYADIERGTVNMRMETLIRICSVLQITPDDVLTEEVSTTTAKMEDILSRLDQCSPRERDTALKLLDTYLQSLQ